MVFHVVRVSPYQALLAACSVSCAARDLYNDKPLSNISKLGLVQAGIFVLGAGGNLAKYREITEIIQSRGYNTFMFNQHLNTLCGRRVLRAAAKDNGVYDLYKKHLEMRQVKWHEFERNPCLRIASAGNILLSLVIVGCYPFEPQK